MGTYAAHEFRQMASDPAHDRRPLAMPTQPFDAWLRDVLASQDADRVLDLVEDGWSITDAAAFVAANPLEGGGE